MWPFSKRGGIDQLRADAPLDQVLYELVRKMVREEVGELIDSGRVKLTERRDRDGGELELAPSLPGATGLTFVIWDDTVAFYAGGAGADQEVWSINDGWDETVREVIQCVRDGRYSETVEKGWFFPLKVTMRFDGVYDGKGRVWEPGYASTLSSSDGQLPMPPTGTFTYEAW